MKTFLLLSAVLILSHFSSICVAQNINISGTVTDTGTTPLSGAVVLMEKHGYRDTTDANGNFTLTGIVGINDQINQSVPYKLLATIKNGLLYINVVEKSAVEIVAYTLQGRVISTIQKTMDAGTHSIVLPYVGAGIYFYKVKTGDSELVIKSHSIGKVSTGTVVLAHSSSATALSKYAMSRDTINDVIKATKAGYLNNRMVITNSDTSGIEIKMISQDAGTVTDIDGNVYQAVQIGNQVWTVENLRVTKYNDGTAIPLVTDDIEWADDTIGAYCYYNNTTNADTIKKWGALYNWYVVAPTNPKKITPTGWLVPTDAEWDTLQNYLIANGYNWDETTTGNRIAKAMAARTDLCTTTVSGTPGNDPGSNNSSGFSGLPGGYRWVGGDFDGQRLGGYWWSATEYNMASAWRYGLTYEDSNLRRYFNDQRQGFSVRLVKD